MPVSRTRNTISCFSRATSSVIVPFSVNFAAFESRFSSICRSFVDVGVHRAGLRGHVHHELVPIARDERFHRGAHILDDPAGVGLLDEQVHAPRFDLRQDRECR